MFVLSKVNPEKVREDFRSKSLDGEGVKGFMDSLGLGTLVDQVRKGICHQGHS